MTTTQLAQTLGREVERLEVIHAALLDDGKKNLAEMLAAVGAKLIHLCEDLSDSAIDEEGKYAD